MKINRRFEPSYNQQNPHGSRYNGGNPQGRAASRTVVSSLLPIIYYPLTTIH
jgi:hypothetical protein